MIEKKVVLVVAYEGYQHMEYNETKKVLTTAKIQVITASDKMGYALALNGSTTAVNVTLNTLNVTDYDGIFFIGGPGALEHLDNDPSYRIIQKAAQGGLVFGAICISTRILAYAGVLTNRRATGWNGDKQLEKIYREYDAVYAPEAVVVDGNCITAADPQAANDFGQSIVKGIRSQE